MYVCLCLCIYIIYIYVYVHICVYTCMYIYTCMCLNVKASECQLEYRVLEKSALGGLRTAPKPES